MTMNVFHGGADRTDRARYKIIVPWGYQEAANDASVMGRLRSGILCFVSTRRRPTDEKRST